MGSKFGIVFAFLLSLAAAAGAYYLYQGLTAERESRIATDQKYNEAKEKVLNLQSEKEQIRAAKEQYQAESAEYQRKVKNAETQLNQLKTETSKALAERLTLAQQLREKEARLAEMENKIAELQKQAEDAMRACNITPSDVKTSAAAVQGGMAYNIPVTTSPVIAAPVVGVQTPEVSAASAPAPVLTGTRVLTVNRKFNFVVVNMGLKDGLKMGEQLKVVRSGVDSATLQVEKLYDKFSAATIVNEDSKDQVKEGDEVRKS